MVTELVNGNVLKFSFPNILLADSNINEPASHGYIQYRINQKSTNVLGDEIKNTANIYFDFNEPVITNTTSSLLAVPSEIELPNSLDLDAFPNPFSNALKVVIENESIVNIKVYNNLGQIVFSSLNINKSITINTEEWTKGLYMLEVNNGETISVKKLVKE